MMRFIIALCMLGMLMFDLQAQGNIENSRPRVGVGVFVIKDGKTLLGKRKGTHGSGYFAPAGGHLEFGETVEECAIRELEEETGLKTTSVKLGPWTQDLIDGSKHYITLFAIVSEFEGEPQLLEPDKCEGWEWYSWDELPSPLFPSVVTLIDAIGIEGLKTLALDRVLQ